MAKLPISDDFEALAAATIAERGPVPTKAGKGRARVLKVVDKAGKVTGYATHGEVLEAVARVAEIEIAVVDGSRPAMVTCIDCNTLRPVSNEIGFLPKRCQPCQRAARKKANRDSAARRRAANPEKARQYESEQRKKHPDMVNEKQRAHYRRDLEKSREASRRKVAAKRAEDPELARAKERERYAKARTRKASTS